MEAWQTRDASENDIWLMSKKVTNRSYIAGRALNYDQLGLQDLFRDIVACQDLPELGSISDHWERLAREIYPL